MSFPNDYTRAKDFSADLGAATDHANLNTELDNLGAVTNAVLASLKSIQRSDAALANSSVHTQALSTAVLVLIAASAFVVKGAWLTATAYILGDIAEESGNSYICSVAHTSGTFATDDTAGYWVVLASSAPISTWAATLVDDATADDALTTLGLTAFAKSLVDDADAINARNTLNMSTKVLAKSSLYTLVATDNSKTILATTAAAWSLKLLTAASAGDGYQFTLKNIGTAGNAVTIDPDGAELIDGNATFALYDGETAIVTCDGSTWKITVIADYSTALHGQCRFEYVSTTQVKLVPFNGNKILVKDAFGWRTRKIPSAGVVLANTGLTAATEYDVYLYDSAGTLTLGTTDHSVTGHAVDADTGVEIESGDATRTLVGNSSMDAGTPGTFADLHVTSRFNGTTIQGGWQRVATTPVGTGAALAFETGFDAGYEHEFTVEGVYPDVADYLVFRVKEAGAYVASAAAYRVNVLRKWGSTVDGYKGQYVSAHICYATSGGASASEGAFGTIELFNSIDASVQTRWKSVIGYGTSSASGDMSLGIGLGEREAAAACQGVRFLWNGGNNFAGGTITHRRRKNI